MDILDLNLIVLLQRTIELLAFYLILANIHGKDLKEALKRLFKIPQQTFYGNVVVLIFYPVVLALLFQILPTYMYLIDHLLRPFVAHFLLRRVFQLNKALISFLILMVVGFIFGIFAFIFSLDATFVFLWFLSSVMFMAHQNYFEGLYVRLVKRKRLLNVVTLLSFAFFLSPLFVEGFPVLFPLMLSLLLILGTIVYIKKELSYTIKRIRQATSDDFFIILKDLSSEYEEFDYCSWYIIRNQNVLELAPILSKKLDFQCLRGTIENYECITSKRQIKINVLL